MHDSTPKILIHEYITGGGWKEPELPESLASEGFLMLSALLDDFMKWGRLKVCTTLDNRLAGASIVADSITIIDQAEYEKTLSSLAKECDFAIIIAPESNGILADLNGLMKENNTVPLGCNIGAIRVTGDKWECHKMLSKAGIPVPETIVETGFKPVSTARLDNPCGINFPLIIKPVDGVGCEGVNLVKDAKTLRTLLEDDQLYPNRVLFQEYIKGEHLSASILSTGKEFIILSLNRQHISEGTPFRYSGGEIMPPPDKGDELHYIVKKIIEVIPGLKGYFGVDLIKSNAGYRVIEINPRLTTSYTGLRKVTNINLAEAIYESVINGRLPDSVKISGNYTFAKEMMI
ncbi:MAG: ATP-grasp domain-containing protein [Desulfatiglans sp.]|jgi:predicted ATP-grasp superfamily ATP-dependent carboligase|nr:ATP-grasp domain-containing protein [Desulfatiglans sp.]